MVFTVTLQAAGSQALTLQYATVDGTATAGTDYTATSGQLVFAADETERQVSVPVTDDAEAEDLAVEVQLVGAAGPSASATGTIIENDVVTVSVTAPDVRETDGQATFTGSLSSASSYRMVVEYETSDGTATAGADYLEASGELVFAPGETEKSVAVQVLDDDLVEGAETLLLTMTVVPRGFGSPVGQGPPIRTAGSGATGGESPASLQVTGMIRDDDLARTRGTGTSRTLYRPSCCASCRSAKSRGWAAGPPSPSTSASQPRPTATWKPPCTTARSARTLTFRDSRSTLPARQGLGVLRAPPPARPARPVAPCRHSADTSHAVDSANPRKLSKRMVGMTGFEPATP